MSKLGYWNHRALAGSIRFLLHYVGEEFEDIRYQVGPPPKYDKSEWSDVKNSLPLSAPNLPYYINEADNVFLTQSHAILFYLGGKYNLQGKSLIETTNAIMALEVMQDWMDAFFHVTYCEWYECPTEIKSNEQQAEISSPLFEKKSLQYKCEILPKHLNMLEAIFNANQGQWLVSDSLTFADFALAEYLDQHFIFCNDSISAEFYPGICGVYERFMNLLEISEYRSSSQYKAEPIHNRYSHFHCGWIK